MEEALFQFTFLVAVLGIAALVSVALRMPVVPLYIASGIGLGIWFEANDTVHLLGSLGVVFLLFSMGLEFSISSFAEAPSRLIRAGSLDLLMNFPIGIAVGSMLGWSWIESLFLAGILYMSSSAVVSKCVVEFDRAARPETETILQILVFEDIVIAGVLVALGVLAHASGPDPQGMGDLVQALFLAFAFIGVLGASAMFFQGPIASLLRARSEESFTLVLVAFVLTVACAALWMGLSEAVGAFLAGLVVGSTPLKERASSTLRPFQTLFAALFFVAFGMGLDFQNFGEIALMALLLILLGLATKIGGGYLAGRSVGHSPRLSMVVGISLIPKGEFSIVLAGLAATIADPGTQIEALTGVYVFALSILGPIAMREADRLAPFILRTARAPSPRSKT